MCVQIKQIARQNCIICCNINTHNCQTPDLDSLESRNREAIDRKLAFTDLLSLLIHDEVARRDQKKLTRKWPCSSLAPAAQEKATSRSPWATAPRARATMCRSSPRPG